MKKKPVWFYAIAAITICCALVGIYWHSPAAVAATQLCSSALMGSFAYLEAKQGNKRTAAVLAVVALFGLFVFGQTVIIMRF